MSGWKPNLLSQFLMRGSIFSPLMFDVGRSALDVGRSYSFFRREDGCSRLKGLEFGAWAELGVLGLITFNKSGIVAVLAARKEVGDRVGNGILDEAGGRLVTGGVVAVATTVNVRAEMRIRGSLGFTGASLRSVRAIAAKSTKRSVTFSSEARRMTAWRRFHSARSEAESEASPCGG